MHDITGYSPPGELLFDAAAVQDAVARQAVELRPQLENENPLVLVLMQGALYYAAWLTLALAIPLASCARPCLPANCTTVRAARFPNRLLSKCPIVSSSAAASTTADGGAICRRFTR
jgi:hypothetical protein